MKRERLIKRALQMAKLTLKDLIRMSRTTSVQLEVLIIRIVDEYLNKHEPDQIDLLFQNITLLRKFDIEVMLLIEESILKKSDQYHNEQIRSIMQSNKFSDKLLRTAFQLSVGEPHELLNFGLSTLGYTSEIIFRKFAHKVLYDPYHHLSKGYSEKLQRWSEEYSPILLPLYSALKKPSEKHSEKEELGNVPLIHFLNKEPVKNLELLKIKIVFNIGYAMSE